MQYIHKSIAWLDALAFVAPALAVLSVVFVPWMPAVGVCLSALGLVVGFFGWITASENGDGSARYLLIGAVASTFTLLLSLTMVTGAFFRLF